MDEEDRENPSAMVSDSWGLLGVHLTTVEDNEGKWEVPLLLCF